MIGFAHKSRSGQALNECRSRPETGNVGTIVKFFLTTLRQAISKKRPMRGETFLMDRFLKKNLKIFFSQTRGTEQAPVLCHACGEQERTGVPSCHAIWQAKRGGWRSYKEKISLTIILNSFNIIAVAPQTISPSIKKWGAIIGYTFAARISFV